MADLGKMLIDAAKRTPGITVIEVDVTKKHIAIKQFDTALKEAGYTYEKHETDDTENYWFHGKTTAYRVEIFNDGYMVAWDLNAPFLSKERRAIETDDLAVMAAELKKLL